ncbi:PREDICTED: glutamate-rich WD repeat-containing protein 1-like [Amphimedon queenslandica]|uniref:Glutamate-rich WD repeat-containing protein 1 n=1 Tax=Amphimedon queenslandica TaxID=400682 RepID=A0A1X7UF59_AMPQE|nr:PREDICTED: glutamate-rich WD repeat-containing protein 1-like [Amphimedon queenslandica]|eukprot:XP_011405355.1 PREDICTED: glutamate-rich WD repeat-containing protein 1-like [Amphimedon queenslandica]
MDEEEYVEEMEEEGEREEDDDKEVFIPGLSNQEGEGELVHDQSAYHMYHTAQTGAPCLSFDILKDSLGESRTTYPMTAYLVGGTQAELGKQNHIILMKMHQLHSTLKEPNEDDDESDDDELENESPELETVMIQHTSTINRIRVAPIRTSTIVATWAESGSVHLWDVSKHCLMLDSPGTGGAPSIRGHIEKPMHTFNGHKCEGYGLDWNEVVPGRMCSGDNNGNIHIWNYKEGGTWTVDKRPFTGHRNSIEDLQWSHDEPTVFTSCSSDGSIRVWDIRAPPTKGCMIALANAHESDVNVINWNKYEPYIVSGGDDCLLKIWDLRLIQSNQETAAVSMFSHHTKPVVSVEWNDNDSSVFASASEDNQIVQWDLSVEKDDEASISCQANDSLKDIPPQLLFIHQGQEEIKELHWHCQLPGVLVSTAGNGFNIFKTISV